LPVGALRGIEEFLGEVGLLLVDGQELGGGLEVRARQASLTELAPGSRRVVSPPS
jgi:hypothetical protein